MSDEKFQPLFKVGDNVRLEKPGYAENGMSCVIGEILPYDGPRYLDRWMYKPIDGWKGFPAGKAAMPERWLVKINE